MSSGYFDQFRKKPEGSGEEDTPVSIYASDQQNKQEETEVKNEAASEDADMPKVSARAPEKKQEFVPERGGTKAVEEPKQYTADPAPEPAAKASAFEKVAGQEIIVEGDPLPHGSYSGMDARHSKIVKLEQEARRRNEVEQQKGKWMLLEQEYLDRMMGSVEDNLRSAKEQRESNERFRRHIQLEVYRMHGISEDKLQGMEERKTALYQGTAFALFFLSLILIILCGVLHGFNSEITLFISFYTAIEGALLTKGRRRFQAMNVISRILYLVLLPIMLICFVMFELKIPVYAQLTPIFSIVGLVILAFGAVSYFLYDPYSEDRRNRRKADKYVKKMEKTAQQDIKAREKEFEKMQKAEAGE